MVVTAIAMRIRLTIRTAFQQTLPSPGSICRSGHMRMLGTCAQVRDRTEWNLLLQERRLEWNGVHCRHGLVSVDAGKRGEAAGGRGRDGWERS